MTTADSASKQELADVREDLAALKIQFRSTQHDMPSFQKAAVASELLSPPTLELWTAFFAALGLPEQPDRLIGSSSYTRTSWMLGAAKSARLMAV